MRSIASRILQWTGVSVALVFVLFHVSRARAQEGIRVSLAGEQAAEDRRKENAMPEYYNLKWGDFQVRLRSSLTVEADDNVTLVQSNREGDILISPGLTMTASYPLSQENVINLDIGAGYLFYVEHPDLDQVFIQPGTALSFDIYIKDVLLNLHDRLSVINQAYQNSAVGGLGNYVYLENVSGLSATWDLNRVELTAGYDHVERQSLTSSINTEDGSEDLFTTSAGLHVNATSEVGLEGTSGIIRYDEPSLNGGVQYSVGAYYKAQLTENIFTRLSAGYFIFDLTPTGITTNNNFHTSVDSFYGSIHLTHRINSRFNYSVDAGREIQSGLFSDTLDLYYARLSANSSIVRKFPITASFSYENGTETGGAAEKIERFGFGAGISRALMEKLNSSLWYQGYVRHSNLPSGRYTENEISLTLSYSF